MIRALGADSRNSEIDHFLGSTGQAAGEFDRLSETVTSEADFLAFLEALLRDDHFTDWEGPIEGYLDRLISWLRSTEGRRRMAAYPNEFSAMAAAFYVGIAKVDDERGLVT
ncbi:hypothetical protein [Micromonospora sp. NPDC048842]|uniref:hypothetical protein n=1 Tax=unclassified Micromonospora TaxID=2617518 RepID=UPI00340ED718